MPTALNTSACIDALTAVIDRAREQGTSDTLLIAALGEVAVQAAQADPVLAQTHLDALAAITTAAAEAHRACDAMNMARAVFSTP